MLKASWVNVYYHTDKETKSTVFYQHFNDEDSLYQQAVLRNLTIEEIAHLFIPKNGLFLISEYPGDRIVFCFEVQEHPCSPYYETHITVSTCGFICPPLCKGFSIKPFKLTDRMDDILRAARTYCYRRE